MKQQAPPTIELEMARIDEILRRAEQNQLTEEDRQTIRAVFESYAWLLHVLGQKSASIERLRKLVFGASTEKTANVLGQQNEAPAASGEMPSQEGAPSAGDAATAEPSAPKPGHGRHGADDFPGATHQKVAHESLKPGDVCPDCRKGTLYGVGRPGVLIRFVGKTPVQATVYELEKLRCDLCGKVFTAQPPAAAGEQKHDATVASTIALLKYGSGLPFNRLDRLQKNLGIPLAASTQWKIVHAAIGSLRPAYQELIRQAAQGEVLYHDDTTIKILELIGKRARPTLVGAGAPRGVAIGADADRPRDRSGLFTSGVVATRDGLRIALFFSGRRHAGENLRNVLEQRARELEPPIQMCDALSRNMSSELRTILANCLAHGRRQFVDLSDTFPAECRRVLEAFQQVYHHDALAGEQNLSPAERLTFHQERSGPVMEDLHGWLKRQFDQRLVERNSGLGAAINYLLKHWNKLTLFLREPGAPLDNNICERALKKAIVHRKNSLFYKTQRGADTGDIYMSLIYTCELNGANPHDYLTELQRHAAEVAAHPADWMPWNYRATLAATSAA
jgi:transposase